jgi:hypothetical protein
MFATCYRNIDIEKGFKAVKLCLVQRDRLKITEIEIASGLNNKFPSFAMAEPQCIVISHVHGDRYAISGKTYNCSKIQITLDPLTNVFPRPSNLCRNSKSHLSTPMVLQ